MQTTRLTGGPDYNSCANRLYTRRPISDVIRDIKALGTRHILLIDDNFIGNPSNDVAEPDDLILNVLGTAVEFFCSNYHRGSY